MKIKIEELRSFYKNILLNEESYPLVIIHNYSKVIKPRIEIMKRRNIDVDLHNAMNYTNEEFCDVMKISMDTYKKFLPQKILDTEDEQFDFREKYLKE